MRIWPQSQENGFGVFCRIFNQVSVFFYVKDSGKNFLQVPKWQFFTSTEIFKNEPNQNVYTLSGDDKLDVDEVSDYYCISASCI